MSKAQNGTANTSEQGRTSGDRSVGERTVTDEERKDLIEDARQFKNKHENTFRLLSEGKT